MQEETDKLKKDLENNYNVVANKEIIPVVTSGGSEPILEGYLFKRTSNAFKTWNRRWFCLRDNQLVYRYACATLFFGIYLKLRRFSQEEDW